MGGIMERRTFLEGLAAFFGIAGTPVSRAVVPRATTRRRVELQRSPVAGFQYHQGESVWPDLALGAALDLRREADNAYDERAVRVEWCGSKLGYVPRIDNAAISQLLDRGETLSAEISVLKESENPWDRVEFAVFLLEG
jgi:hypothetical protein